MYTYFEPLFTSIYRTFWIVSLLLEYSNIRQHIGCLINQDNKNKQERAYQSQQADNLTLITFSLSLLDGKKELEEK